MDPLPYAVPSEKFRSTLANLPKNYHYLIIFHFSHNNLAYLQEWLKAVSVLGVISIPYSEHADVKAEVAKQTEVYSPPLADVSRCLVSICAEHIDKEIILIEIGGYGASVSQLLPNVVLAIEDTARGHERYKEAENTLIFPVVSVARTSGKQQEDDPVGNAIAISANKVVQQLGASLRGVNVVVLGYGGVGRATAKYVRAQGANVDVHDPDATRVAIAKKDGFNCQDRANLLAQADVIIGCSGHQSLSLEDISNLKNDAILISGSSRQVEFPYAEIHATAIDSVKDGVLEEFTIHGKSLKVAYAGQPINFYYDISLGDIFDIPMTLLAQAVLHGTSQQLQPGLHELPS